MNKQTIRDLPDTALRGKRVLVRVDFNVPLDDAGGITDDTRIQESLATIRALGERGARVVLLSHLGRPKGKAEAKYSLAPVAARLQELLEGTRVTFVPSTVGAEATKAVKALKNGDVALLENTRFLPGEESNDEGLARELAGLGDVYVNDAFGSAHRAHASTEGVARVLRPAVAGLLMERELKYLGAALAEPERPFVAIMGGAKISGKIDVIEKMLPKVDHLVIGGAMACTFFRAVGMETGKSLVEDDRLVMARSLYSRAGDKLLLPSDATVAPAIDRPADAHAVPRDEIPAKEAMFDIGPESAASFARVIGEARTIVWNGPMGVFETKGFDHGTRAVAEAMWEPAYPTLRPAPASERDPRTWVTRRSAAVSRGGRTELSWGNSVYQTLSCASAMSCRLPRASNLNPLAANIQLA